MEFVWPIFAGLGFILKLLNKVFLEWWLDPMLQSRANKALWDDVRANLSFLYSKGRPIIEEDLGVLPFDYASVYLLVDNLKLCLTRGRGEVNVSLSPRHSPGNFFELSTVIAALDSIDITAVSVPNDLPGLGDLLGRRLNALNDAFSENKYPEFRERLLKMKDSARNLIRQTEWELDNRLYR